MGGKMRLMDGPFVVTPGDPVRAVVDKLILRTVRFCGDDQSKAARLLEIDPKTISRRLRQMKGAS